MLDRCRARKLGVESGALELIALRAELGYAPTLEALSVTRIECSDYITLSASFGSCVNAIVG